MIPQTASNALDGWWLFVSHFSKLATVTDNFDSVYSKVAPQNIMFDRRVVRGNTFAALVIPVNMQPDPMVMQQQQRIKENKRRRQMEMIRNQQIEEQKFKEQQQMGGQD